MATNYPKEHTIRFAPISGVNQKEHTLLISIVHNDSGPSLMIQEDAPMKILTASEMRNFVEWLIEELAPQNPLTATLALEKPLAEQEWNRVNDAEPWGTHEAAMQVRKIRDELASYLDIEPDQALLILLETLLYQELA
jgi:hypothetical protein